MPFRPSLQPLSFPQTTTVIHISVLWVHLHFLEFYIHGTICYVLSCFSHVWLCAILWTVACQSLLCPRNFPGKNTGVGCHFLLQGIIPTWRSNPTSPALAGGFFFFFFFKPLMPTGKPRNHTVYTFLVWLPLLSIIILRFIFVFVCINNSFLLIVELYFIAQMLLDVL